MSLAYASDEFRANMASGLAFMSENSGPYLFHCTEGKDRAGFMGALVGAFMGATETEIVEDYMVSYMNYYDVEKGTERYTVISEDVLGMLKVITSTNDLTGVDLAAGAEAYLLAGGMTVEQISALEANLTSELNTTYTVVSGDNLWNIAKMYLGDGMRYKEIYELNTDFLTNPDLIHIGDELVLPLS
jgi:hypothetical protein